MRAFAGEDCHDLVVQLNTHPDGRQEMPRQALRDDMLHQSVLLSCMLPLATWRRRNALEADPRRAESRGIAAQQARESASASPGCYENHPRQPFAEMQSDRWQVENRPLAVLQERGLSISSKAGDRHN